MNKIPTRCSNSILLYFPLFSALHVSGVTITHHQDLPLYIRVWYNNINRSLAERSVCQNRIGGGECGSEMPSVRVSEPQAASRWKLIHQITMHGNTQLK
jgi:hypothetical protein